MVAIYETERNIPGTCHMDRPIPEACRPLTMYQHEVIDFKEQTTANLYQVIDM